MKDQNPKQGASGKSIALVLPYFGVLPNYFSYWLESAGKNESIDFLLFSDCDFAQFDIPANVKVYETEFGNIKERAENILGFRVALDRPYKLCDFKPLFGLVFAPELDGYDYWGHCDSDVIWGDLRKFLKPGLSGNYDRLLSNGHLCLYRNDPSINRLVFQPPTWEHVTYRDIYRMPGSMAYDESGLIEDCLITAGGRQWDSDCFADVDFRVKQFVRVYKGKRLETLAYFQWQNGSLFGYQPLNGCLARREFAYLHLQKRNMKTIGLPLECSAITPTAFDYISGMDDEHVSALIAPDSAWEKRWERKVFKNKLENNLKGFAFIKAKRWMLNRREN